MVTVLNCHLDLKLVSLLQVQVDVSSSDSDSLMHVLTVSEAGQSVGRDMIVNSAKTNLYLTTGDKVIIFCF